MSSIAQSRRVALYHQAQALFFSAISQRCWHFDESLAVYCTGVASSSLNLLFVKQAGPDLAAGLVAGIDFLERAGSPFCVVVHDELLAPVRDLLVERRWSQGERTTAMVLDLSAHAWPMPRRTDVDIRRTDEHLEDWAGPVESAFEAGEAGAGQYLARHRAAQDSGQPLVHFTLYAQSRPVSSLTLSLAAEVARLDDIGTRPECQGRGYASALIQHALAHAQDQGAGLCVLEASAQGLSIYRKAGFSPLFGYTTFYRE
ncbi:GNAT family N-acetyltransferase [Pseudomonas chlororaphis]|uniref:GNAT family acetyltransferase n=1 Tax=Pseudomonas chlororaphis TaxID=587753 RepID=A0A0D5Y4F0_9PSED|nr:GNAT family N-acetyltransferase [Pseudomonas chlororaphis]AKA26151.1 GNAT family acetyltransferase [Pseudomonas chlororaphis]